MEKVWLAEQAADKERQKLEEFQREKRKESSLEEIQSLHGRKSNQRYICQGSYFLTFSLEWMYAGPSKVPEAFSDEFLLGKRKYRPLSPEETRKGPDFPNTLESKSDFISEGKDLEQKSREDPLLFIRKKELELARKSHLVRKNIGPASKVHRH